MSNSNDSLQKFLNTINSSKILNSLPKMNKDLSKIISTISKLNDAFKDYTKQSQQADNSLFDFLKDSDLADKLLENYKEGLEENGDAASALSSSAQKAGSALKSLGSSLLTVGFDWIVNAAIDGISYLVTYEERQAEAFKNAKRNAKEMEEQIAELSKTQNQKSGEVSNVAAEFASLYQGVDQSTNKNISLTNEEYERFLEINNQLADSLDGSAMKWDENGNAILRFSGNVEQVTNEIKEAQNTQKFLNQQAMNEKVENYIDGEDDSEGVPTALAGYKDELEYQKTKQKILQALESKGEFSYDLGSEEESAFGDVVNDLGLEYVKDIYFNANESKSGTEIKSGSQPDKVFQIKDDSYKKVSEKFASLREQYEDEVQSTEDVIKLQNQKISSAMMQWFEGESEYQNASENEQDLITRMVGQIQWDEDGDFNSYTETIKKDIYNKVNAASANIEFKVQLQAAFEEDYSDDSAEDALNKLQNHVKGLIDSSKGNLTYTKDETGQSDYDRLMLAYGGGDEGIIAKAKAKNQVLAYATGKTYSQKEHLDYAKAPNDHKNFSEDELRRVMEQNGIDTQSEYNAFLDILKNDKINSPQSAASEYNVKNIGGHKDFDTAWNDLDSVENDNLINLKKNLMELAETGKLTEQTFNEQTGATLFLDQIGLSAKEATDKINHLVDESKQLSSMRTGITAITSAYDEKNSSNTHTVSSSTLSSMRDTLGVDSWSDKNKEVWEDYKSVAGDGKSSMEDLKAAQDRLASSYVNSNNFLAQLNNTNKDYYTSLLEEMGITNAKSIVTQTLIANEDEAVTSKINAQLASINFANATNEEITGLSNELTALYGSSEALGLYVLKKQLSNENALDTSESVANLIALSKQCGLTGKTVNWLANLEANLAKLEELKENGGGNGAEWNHTLKEIEHYQKLVTKAANKKVTVKASTTDNKNTNSSKPKSDKSDKTKKTKQTKQEIDWLERRLARMQNIIDLTASKLQNLFSVKKKNKNLDDQIKQSTKLMNQYGVAAKRYQKKADKVAKGNKKKKVTPLSESLIKKIQSGELTKKSYPELIKKYGEKKANQIQEYINWYDKAQDAKKNKQDQNAKKRELKQQKNQNYVDLYDSRTARAEAKEAIQTNAKDKNKAVDTQIKNTKLSYQYQIKIANLTKNKAEAEKLQYEQEKKIAELKLQQIQNLQDEYDKVVGRIDNDAQDIDNAIALAQARGQTLSAGYYQSLNKLQTTKRQEAVTEKSKVEAALAAALKDESIKKDSDEWYEVQSTLQGLENTINECDVAIAENTTAIRELHTTMLEEMTENANRMNTEADFLANLLSRKDLTDSDTGTFTNAGLGTLGTYGINMETAQAQMRELEKERAILEQMKETGSLDYGDNGKHKYDSDNQLEDAYNDILDKQQEWTQNEYDAEQKIIDLMKEYYQSQLDYMKEIIDAKKNALDYEKDLYDYQKNIAEKTKSIATLEKQAAALKGDNSEEGRARMAKIQLSLDEANQDLQDTEYDRYISDQQNMLDNMYSEYEDLMNHLFKDTDKLLQEGIDVINKNGTLIKSIFDKTAADYSYNYSDRFREITDAFTASDSIVTGIKDSINGNEDSSISKRLETINTTIENKYENPSSGGGGDKDGGGGDNGGGAGGGNTSQDGNYSPRDYYENGQDAANTMEKDANSNFFREIGTWLNAPGKNRATGKTKGVTSDLNKKLVKHWGVALSNKNNDKEFKAFAKKLGVSQKVNYTKNGAVYKKLKENINGFQTGGIIRANGVPLKGDNIPIRVNPNETVLTQDFTDVLPMAVDVMDQFVKAAQPNYNALPNSNVCSQSIGDIVIHAELPNVENTQDFVYALQNDSKVQKAFAIAAKDLMSKGRITNNIQSVR